MSRNLPVRRGRSAAALASVIQKRSVARPVNLNALFKVYLLDDSFKILQLSETSTILDVIVDLKFKLELNDASNFAVFLETDSFERLELDIKAHTLPVFDYLVTGFRYVFCSWVVNIHGVFYSKALFDIEQSVEKHDSSMELYLAYIEANYSIMKTNKWKLLEEDAIYLGCLHLQISSGDYNVGTHSQEYMQNKVSNSFPSPIKERFLSFLKLYEEKNGRNGTKKDDKKEQNSILDAQKAEFLGKITRQYERLQGIDKVTAQYRLIRYLTLMTPYYGCSEFINCTVQFMRQVANVTNETETSDVNNENSTATTASPVEMQEFYPYDEKQCEVSVCVSFIQLTPKKLSEKNGKSDKNCTNNSTISSTNNIIKHLYSRIIHYIISTDNATLTYYVLKNTVSLQDFEEIYSETEETSFNYQTYCDCIQIICDNPDATVDNNSKTTVKMSELCHLFSSYYHLQRDGVRPFLPYAPEELLSPLDMHAHIDSTADDTATNSINSNKSDNKVASTVATDKHKQLHSHNKYVTATNKNIALSYVHISPSVLVTASSQAATTTGSINSNYGSNSVNSDAVSNVTSDLSSETTAKLHISGPTEQQPTTTTGLTTTVTSTCSTEESVMPVDSVSNLTFDASEGVTTTATGGATVSANENPTADLSTEQSAEQPALSSRPAQVLSKRVTKAQQLLVELKEKQEKQREKKQELLLKQKALGIDILYDKSDVLTAATGTDTTNSDSHSTNSNNSNKKLSKIASDSLLQIETLNFNGESDQILPSLNSTRAIRRSFRRGSVFHVQSNPSKVQNNNNNNNNSSDNSIGGNSGVSISNSNSRPTSVNINNIGGITISNNSSTNSSRNNSIVNGISNSNNSIGISNNSSTNSNNNSEKSSPIKYENLSNAKLITESNLTELCEKLRECSSNEEMLSKLEIEKVPFLFTSDSLAVLLELTPSVKTRIAIILTVAPRLADPKVKIDYFLNLFRYADEKAQVEEVFKSRIQTINGSLFIRGESGNSPIRPVLGSGRGGRGRGLRPALSPVNRGSGNTSPTSPNNNSGSGNSSNVFSESNEDNHQSASEGTSSTANTTSNTAERSKSRIGALISNKKSAINTNTALEKSDI